MEYTIIITVGYNSKMKYFLFFYLQPLKPGKVSFGRQLTNFESCFVSWVLFRETKEVLGRVHLELQEGTFISANEYFTCEILNKRSNLAGFEPHSALGPYIILSIEYATGTNKSFWCSYLANTGKFAIIFLFKVLLILLTKNYI